MEIGRAVVYHARVAHQVQELIVGTVGILLSLAFLDIKPLCYPILFQNQTFICSV